MVGGSHYLFIGDSVTDCGRMQSPNGLGDGYVDLINTYLAPRSMTVINRGISGNRVADLRTRWATDCVDLHPDLISILIGVNDTWRRYDQDDPTSAASYRSNYETLLSSARTANPQVAFVLVEPFIVPVRAEQARWVQEDLEDKIAAVHALAQQFSAILVPAHQYLGDQGDEVGPDAIAPDGVHPSLYGHRLLADLWMSCVEQ